MALRFIDGADHYATADIPKKWTLPGGAIIANNGRGGGNNLRLGSQNSVTKNLDSQPTWIVGAAYYFNTSSSTFNTLLTLSDNTTIQVYLRFNADRTISVISGSTVLVTSSATVALGIYNYIEFKCTINSSISANTCKVNLNGTTICNVSAGSSTQVSSNASANSIAILTPYLANNLDIDDIYICDGTVGAGGGGMPNNNFLGVIMVETIFPNGNGNVNNFINSNSNSTNNYTYVNETPPDNDTTYVASNTPGNIDLYAYQSMLNAQSIFGIQQILDFRKDQAGNREAAPVVRLGSTNYVSSNIEPTSDYDFALQIREINPSTSLSWVTADINAAQFGVKLVS